MWFEIGSISKSFVALTLLQLKDEGKLDLGRPILEYLPWLPIETNYGPVTAHHLLNHTSGLGNGGLFLSDILRHTGGMISFASALHADLDSGGGAFASLNVQLGYRPNPVTQFAVQLMRAQLEGKELPKAPELPDPFAVASGADYGGVYTSPDNRTIEVLARDGGLAVKMEGDAVRLRSAGGDSFWAIRPDLRRFPFVFGRAAAKAEEKEKPKVVEVAYGNS